MTTTEAIKVAGNLLEAIKTQPLVWALVLTNFGLLGYILYSGHGIQAAQSETNKTLAACMPIQDLDKIIQSLKLGI